MHWIPSLTVEDDNARTVEDDNARTVEDDYARTVEGDKVKLQIFREAAFPTFQKFVKVVLRDFARFLKRMPKRQIRKNGG